MEVYACYKKNLNQQKQSSSGGIYPLLANYFISQGGIVYAVCYDTKLEPTHCRISTVSEIEKSYGSKYVTSRLGDTFKFVKADLDQQHRVLFVGTPCQCAGLKAFIGKDSKSLFCIDFICHGVPELAAWRGYLTSLRNRGINVEKVNMRDKSKGWNLYSMKLYHSNGVLIESHKQNTYLQGFLKDIYLRPSCYKCAFKSVERYTDITLADYWSIKEIQPDMYHDNGTSLVFIHSENGEELFSSLKESINYKKAQIDKAIQANPAINHSPIAHKRRQEFYDRIYSGEDFISVTNDLLHVRFFDKVKRKIKRILKNNLLRRGANE